MQNENKIKKDKIVYWMIFSHFRFSQHVKIDWKIKNLQARIVKNLQQASMKTITFKSVIGLKSRYKS